MSLNTWVHKDLLDTSDLSTQEIIYLLDSAKNFHEINQRPVKKVPTLKGKTVVLFFSEPSTRTKLSFDTAGKRLSADTFALGKSGSSVQKGESLKDTALTLQAMNPDIIIIRDSSSGAAKFLSERLNCSIVNAGDGWHAHPTQALLDAYSLRNAWNGEFQGKTLLILGDINHSRVARSNVNLLTRLGVNVRVCAPRTLFPRYLDNWPVTVYNDLSKAIVDVDAVMCLRLQLERQASGLLPNLGDYASRFCLTQKALELAKPHAKILHPGPMNRGLEIASDVADCADSLVLNQVSAGVATRMAVLYLYGTRNDANTNAMTPIQ